MYPQVPERGNSTSHHSECSMLKYTKKYILLVFEIYFLVYLQSKLKDDVNKSRKNEVIYPRDSKPAL